MNFLKGLGLDLATIGVAIDDRNLEQSYQLIRSTPKIKKDEFLTIMGIEVENDESNRNNKKIRGQKNGES